jgi:thiol-disulfide isomerase/thioredoxin
VLEEAHIFRESLFMFADHKTRLSVGALALTFFAATAGTADGAISSARVCPSIAAQAPRFTLPRARGGDEVSLSALLEKKRPIVIDFWRHDCVPCLLDLPELQKLAAEWGEQVSVVTVHSDDAADAEAHMLAMLDKLKVTLPTGFDAFRKVGERYCVDAFPKLWVIDASGTLRATVQGEQKNFIASVRAAVAPLLRSTK